ncbi:MAG: hypothetical protein J0L88_00220 [Xanthomonadales bacterium]|nr:hypothetical protein [Xanthomonadales bacterium]
MQKPLLDILCCPVTRSPLRMASATELDALNASIAAGDGHAGGKPARPRVVAALAATRGGRYYRIEDDIPVLLAEEAILVGASEALRSRSSDGEM